MNKKKQSNGKIPGSLQNTNSFLALLGKPAPPVQRRKQAGGANGGDGARPGPQPAVVEATVQESTQVVLPGRPVKLWDQAPGRQIEKPTTDSGDEGQPTLPIMPAPPVSDEMFGRAPAPVEPAASAIERIATAPVIEAGTFRVESLGDLPSEGELVSDVQDIRDPRRMQVAQQGHKDAADELLRALSRQQAQERSAVREPDRPPQQVAAEPQLPQMDIIADIAEMNAPKPSQGEVSGQGQAAATAQFVLKGSVGAAGANDPLDVQAVKGRLVALGFDWLSVNQTMDSDTIAAIKLFQSISSGKNTIAGDGRVDVPGPAYSWLQAVNAPRWQQMPAGSTAEGFRNAELADTSDNHDYGTDWMAKTIAAAAAEYRSTHLSAQPGAALLTVNDVSTPRGGDTPDHKGHETGLACDLKLPRSDGKAGGITYKDTGKYDQSAARAVMQSLRRQPLLTQIFFNDPVLIDEGLCAPLAGHDNHIHFQIKPPAMGAALLSSSGSLSGYSSLSHAAIPVKPAYGLGAASFNVRFDVPLIPQPDKLSCWAASMAMVVSYYKRQSYTPEGLAAQVQRSLRTSYGWDMLEDVKSQFGFKDIPIPDNMSIVPGPQEWYDWLQAYGPLWVTVKGAPSHAIIVHGIWGDLTPGGTTVRISNPWDTTTAYDGDPVEFNPPNRGRAYDRGFRDFASDFINIDPLANVGNWRVLYLGRRAD